MTLRRTPRLRFAYDETFDKGRRIEQLLAEHEPMPDSVPERARGRAGRGAPARSEREPRRGARRSLRDGATRCASARTPRPTATRSGRCSASACRSPRPVATSCSIQDGDEPFPRELAFLQLERIERRVPADAAQRTLIALDCGSALRIDRRGEVAGQFARVVNIDHHHDNTLLRRDQPGRRRGLVHRRDRRRACWTRPGIPLAEGAPLALYVGLVTDTGRFQYANTTPRAHRLAARLLEEGVQPALVFATLFESLPLARQRLLGLALGRARGRGRRAARA